MSRHRFSTSTRIPTLRLILFAATALGMLLLVLIPAGFWSAPRFDARVSGFDPNTMYSDPTGTGQVSGSIDLTPAELAINATPGSAPVVDLTTGPLSYDMSFSVTVSAAAPGSQPLIVDIAAPYTDYHYQVVFTSTPAQQVLLQRTHAGVVLSQQFLGLYALDQRYDMRVILNRLTQTATVTMSTPSSEVQQGSALALTTTSQPSDSQVITKDVVPVVGGTMYSLSAAVKPILPGDEGITVEWLDSARRRINLAADWANSTTGTSGQPEWTGLNLEARAPAHARYARVDVATANGAQALFDQVRLSKTGDVNNLLPNGDFANEAAGWRRASGTEPLNVWAFTRHSFKASITARQWPALFASLRMSVSVSAESTYGLSSVDVTQYRLDLLHQRWLAVQINDWRPRLASILLVLAGLALGWSRVRLLAHAARTRLSALMTNRILAVSPRSIAVAITLLLVYVVGNALLSRIGSLNADIIGTRIFVYTAAHHGPAALYTLPNISSAEAAQWQGLPLQEAGFPYGPVMAYIFGALGVVYHFALHQPVAGPSDLSQIDGLVKATVALFALADSVVAYLILRVRGLGSAKSRLMFIALVFNPAIWFAGSVWGTTQTISLLFLLLAIYFFDRVRPIPAWVFLIASVLTRPQSIFVAVILAAILIRVFPLRRTIDAVASAVIITFIYLLPLALMISPTLPADVLSNALFLHVGNANDAWTMPVSWGGMSIWPVISQFIGHVHGVDRVLYPATYPLIGRLTYYKVGSLLLGAFLASCAGMALLRGRRLVAAGRVPIVLAATSLGTFVLNTGTASYHLILALVLIALTRSALPTRVYWACFGGITATTFLAMYGMGAYWLSGSLTWDVGIYNPASPLTRFMADLPANDLVVTALCLVNILIFLVLVWFAFKPTRPAASAGEATESEIGDWQALREHATEGA
jgi:hypothetical protein